MQLSELEKINELMREKAILDEALKNIAEGGIIVGITISAMPRADRPVAPWVNVAVPYMTYPPQVFTLIKRTLDARHVEIENELKQLGLVE